MKIFFYSQNLAYLKINGRYIGSIFQNLCYYNIEKEDLIEILPLRLEFYPIYFSGNFLINNSIPFNEDKLFIPNFSPKRNEPYKIIYQNKETVLNQTFLITIVSDGCVKFYLDGSVYITEELPFVPKNVYVKSVKSILFLIFEGQKTAIFGYNLAQNSKLVFKKLVDSYNLSENLTTFTNFNTIRNITFKEVWQISDNLSLKYFEEQTRKNLYEINENLIPLDFLQTLLVGGNIDEYLSKNILHKSNLIKEFLGNFDYVFSYAKDNIIQYIIVSKTKATQINFSLENRKINNIYCD